MFEKECVPFAPTLIESMRSLGYSFSSAIADLIDNSVGAKAKRIDIIAEPSLEPEIIILDDGIGMNEQQLEEAMRYGSRNPLEKRSEDDLGRFGLGMKSASLSQCRKLIVASKQKNKVNSLSWDLDYVIEKSSWLLKGFDETEIDDLNHIYKLKNKKSGTYICLRDFDRVREGTDDLQTTFNKLMDEMTEHLSLVFHRYLSNGVSIYVNNKKIDAKDPFLTSHKATQIKREKKFTINNENIILKPYILPHLSKLTNKDIEKVGGKEKLRNEQGFYVYRNKRLIVWGTWFRLDRKDELSKLARVMVDIPNSLDYMWSIDIKKSSATLPDIIKKNMYSAVSESVLNSESVHTYRGRKSKKAEDVDYIWERIEGREGCEYKVNREIPQIRILKELLGDKENRLLENLIATIEFAFPVNTLYLDAAMGRIEEKTENDEKQLWDELKVQIDYIKENKLYLPDYCKAFMSVEPYCKYEGIKDRLIEEVSKYEYYSEKLI